MAERSRNDRTAGIHEKRIKNAVSNRHPATDSAIVPLNPNSPFVRPLECRFQVETDNRFGVIVYTVRIIGIIDKPNLGAER